MIEQLSGPSRERHAAGSGRTKSSSLLIACPGPEQFERNAPLATRHALLCLLVAPADDPAFHQAMGQLMLQVDNDNVVAVHGAFKQHAVNLRAELKRLRSATDVGLCGDDPVSPEAARCFNEKVGQLLAVHWRHLDELEAVAEHLATIARGYAKGEAEITASFSEKPTV